MHTDVDSPSAAELPALRLRRPALIDFEAATTYEWLVTNGIGGYASGTVLGLETRRYHGLLVAALSPPMGRTLLLARVHETLYGVGGEDQYSLQTAEYHDGTVSPAGYLFLEEFRLEGTLPSWRYRCRDVEIEKTLWLEHGRNTVFVRYCLLAARQPLRLRLEPLTTCRDYHTHGHGDPGWRFDVESQPDSCRVRASSGAVPLWLRVPGGRFTETGMWHWRFLHRQERERGYESLEDLYVPGVFGIDLSPGETATLIATTHPEDLDCDPDRSYEGERARQVELLGRAGAPGDDPARQHLVLAADQFIAQRGEKGRTVIAGYHWFTDRGRDAMIALPGLCLATGRVEEARAILTTFARHLDQGLLPGSFPNDGGPPEYTALDATLWLFEALARYERATDDHALVDELLPALEEALAWYERGTRYGIAVDPADGLLQGGAPGLHLTWMDAQYWDWVVTPRQGKPVEAQALWYNALCLMAGWQRERSRDPGRLVEAAERCRASFNQRFWNPARNCCRDVVDGPNGDDPVLRPNQLFAASLSHPILDPGYWEQMLGVVERELLTPFGLRSLAQTEPRYRGTYGGDQASRDSAYHQGTVWPWLIGAYVDVARRVRGFTWNPRPVLEPLVQHLNDCGLGQVSEVFGGDPPHPPAGCIARAWNVAELLRVWPAPALSPRSLGPPSRLEAPSGLS